MIPPLEDGVLPPGVHDATVDEVADVFGRFQRTDRRVTLMDRLRAYLTDARQAGVVSSVIIDGSFVTAKDEPEDIDLIVVVPANLGWKTLRPFEYNIASKAAIRRTYRFDVLVVKDGSDDLTKTVAFFSTVNPNKPTPYTTRTTKGLVRVVL